MLCCLGQLVPKGSKKSLGANHIIKLHHTIHPLMKLLQSIVGDKAKKQAIRDIEFDRLLVMDFEKYNTNIIATITYHIICSSASLQLERGKEVKT